MSRKIIHIDMDCFYAAVEQRDNPSLNNLPVAEILVFTRHFRQSLPNADVRT